VSEGCGGGGGGKMVTKQSGQGHGGSKQRGKSREDTFKFEADGLQKIPALTRLAYAKFDQDM
jgi:hypothetical protein